MGDHSIDWPWRWDRKSGGEPPHSRGVAKVKYYFKSGKRVCGVAPWGNVGAPTKIPSKPN